MHQILASHSMTSEVLDLLSSKTDVTNRQKLYFPLDRNRRKTQLTRLCWNNATDFNKATQVMNLGPGDLFRSYLEKS